MKTRNTSPAVVDTPARFKAKHASEIPENLDDEQRQVYWITEYLHKNSQDERQFINDLLGKDAAEDATDWNSHQWREKATREGIRADSMNLEKAQEAFVTLRACFGFDPRMRLDNDMLERGVGIEEDAMFQQAFDWIERQLKARREFLQKATEYSTGNYPSNRTAYILDIWPVLKSERVSMRAAGRILAEAFERAGLESVDDAKRRESIYQTIRNASR